VLTIPWAVQIENSPAQRGVPILNAKNIINHDEMWGAKKDVDDEYIFEAYQNSDIPTRKLLEFSGALNKEIIVAAGDDNWIDMFLGTKSIPSYLMYLPTCTAVVRDENILPTRLNVLNLLWHGPIDQQAMSVLERLNHALQSMKTV
jgi:hypothetical protein